MIQINPLIQILVSGESQANNLYRFFAFLLRCLLTLMLQLGKEKQADGILYINLKGRQKERQHIHHYDQLIFPLSIV